MWWVWMHHHQQINMSKNFTSVVKLVGPLEPESEKSTAARSSTINTGSNLLQIQDRTVTLPATQPLPLSPLRNAQLQEISFSFDRVFGTSDSQDAIYKQSVKEIVESCLLGYHATVVSFGTELDREQSGNRKEGVLICKAAEQIFRCLKKSRRSKTKSHSSTSKLVVLCSYSIIVQEKVYDLLFGYDSTTTPQQSTAEGSKSRGDGNTIDVELPPELQLLNGSILGASQHMVKSGKKLAPLLKFGRETESKIVKFEQLRQLRREDGSTPQQAMQGVNRTVPGNTHHTALTLTVEYSQFGSMNAPVSGNLMFVDVAASDPLANRQRHTTGDQIAHDFVSLFTFADVIDSLTSNAPAIEGAGSSGSTYNINGEGTQLPCVPETMSKELYQNSLLTQVLQDSLGGNCKTLLITYVPELVLPARYGELYETLKLASRARMIQNTPNKRDLAEKALMSAYMRGLQEMYGQGVLAKQEQQKPRRARIVITSNVSPFDGETEGDDGLENKRALSTSKDSLSSDDIDTAYDEMINMTEGEKRQQNMELAATALVAAALEDREEEDKEKGTKRTATDEDELSSEEEDSDDDSRENGGTKLSHSSKYDDATALQTKVRLKKKKKAPVDARRAALLGAPEGLESASVSSLIDRDITIDVLVNIIQDPDKGVPRPPASALKADVKIRKGSIFCGAELVKWMVQNIDGVENEGDAETLGQLLLDKEALFHTEGSKVFANAESLFYYTAFSRPTKKLLSREEIKRLLAQATASSGDSPTTLTTTVSAMERGKEQRTINANPEGDMTVVELGDSQVNINRKGMAVTKSNKSQRGLHRGDMTITELEESQFSIDRQATSTITKVKGSWPSNTNHEAMAVVDVGDDEGETQNDRMHSSQPHDSLNGTTNEGHSYGDQQQVFIAESNAQKADRSNGKIQQVSDHSAADGQAESGGGILAYDGVASERIIPDMEGTQYAYEVQEIDENATNYEDQIEQAQAELLKRQEEDSGQPNTVAQEHIPSVQTLEKTTNYPHPLHMAVAIGKSSGVVRQLVMMFGVNKRDEYNRTPLMFAALGNNKSSSCSTLIDCGAEIDRQDICGLTALHVACYHGNKAAASVLLNRKASVCVFDNTDHSVYHWSTVSDDHACLQLLMSFATPELVMYADRFGLTALHWAISYDHSDHLKLLLKMCKEPLKHDSEGRTLLTYSIQQQAMQCIKVLLPAHPSLLTHADTNGAYPLHHAAVQKSPQFLEVLLSHKLPKKSKVSVDINCRNGTGQTPLHCVVAYNRLQNATVLVGRGTNVEATDDEGKTCLDYANALGDDDRELMLNVLTGGTESSTRASGELANPSKQSKQTSSSSRICTIL